MTFWPESWSYWDAALLSLALLLYTWWFYHFLISLQGWRKAPRTPPAITFRRFAVIIPAHNEELVIGALLVNLSSQTYSKKHFDVFVSCDRYTDDTARIVTEHGATALCRSDTGRNGKAWNIRWALDQITLDEYDSIVILDADNLAEPDFLAKMNDYLEAHPEAEAVQGFLDTKNPDDSWVTRLYALSYWNSNRFWQLARSRWGLSAMLTGTGLLVRVSCIRRIGWDLQSTTEDLEFTSRLVLAGGRVHWNEFAVAYDEKPITYRASRRQRTRWLQGHLWVLTTLGPRALFKFLTTLRVRYLDLFLHLAIPGRTSISAVAMFAGFFIPAIRFAFHPSWPQEDPLWAVWLVWPLLALLQCALLLVAAPSFRKGGLTLRYVPSVFACFWYGITWVPTVLVAPFTSRNQDRWIKTPHSRSMTLEEIVAD